MTSLFKYELKRLLWNKFYLCLLVITLLYSHQILTTTVVLGVANTAPFSSWSFGYYLSQLLPILSITILFFITFLYSSHEKQVQTITLATPTSLLDLTLIRCAVMAIGYILQCIIITVCAVLFYRNFFNDTNLLKLAPILFLVFLPAFFFVLGIGLLLGKIHTMLLYVFMAICTACSFLPLPYVADPFGTNFFTDYPIELGTIKPAFTIPFTFFINRIIYTIIGLSSFVFMIYKISNEVKKSKK